MTTTEPRTLLVDTRRGPVLCAGEAPMLRRACGCVPVDTTRRCLTAKVLKVKVNGARLDHGEGSVEWHNALLALNAHLNGAVQG